MDSDHPEPLPVQLRVIAGLGRRRSRRRWPWRLSLVVVLVIGAAAAWNRRPRASALHAGESPAHSGAVVVDGGAVRVLDQKAAAELFDLGTAQSVPATSYAARGRLELDPGDASLIRAPRAGRVTAVLVRVGDRVRAGAPVVELGDSAPGSRRLVLRAARAGQVVGIEVAPGALVSPLDDAALVRISGTGRLIVTAAVPEAVAAGVRAGDQVHVATSVGLAEVLDVGAPARPNPNGQVDVRLLAVDPEHQLRAGAVVDLDFALRAGATGQVSVPRSAVVTRRGQSFVLVARADDRLEPVAVHVGREQDGRAEIAGALAPGDRFVDGGAIYLFNMLVLQGVL